MIKAIYKANAKSYLFNYQLLSKLRKLIQPRQLTNAINIGNALNALPVSNTSFIYKCFLFNIALISLLGCLFLTSCSAEPVTGTPKEGDYGKQLVHSVNLTPVQISSFNEESYPKPYDKTRQDDKVQLTFKGDSSKNPYRVVIVANGRAIDEAKVDINFAGVLQKSKPKPTDRPTPQFYREEDDTVYRVYQKAQFIITSEPFSFNNLKETSQYQLSIQLTKKDNINFDTLEVQLWQGLGTKHSSYSQYVLFMVIFIGGFIAYRMVFGVRN